MAAGPELAAAVTNAGGLGVIGGLGYTPKFMKEVIQEVKDNLVDKNAPFGASRNERGPPFRKKCFRIFRT